ncbi:hypothetical protein [Halegenticoccus soli]|uniref:hypothetical protein n=1 Tax=Halegenticoccus soli TaxID=1985678 RepID=UPI000C6DA19E|nr:hypothetical protein [Halegenticoccus soli]
MSDDPTTEARESPIDVAVVRRVADESGVPADELADALVVLDAELLGRHSAYEAEYDYVTASGRRAYLVDADEWESLTADLDVDGRVADAVRRAHAEQARLLFDAAVKSGRFDGDTAGVVVGVDTAEEMV